MISLDEIEAWRYFKKKKNKRKKSMSIIVLKTTSPKVKINAQIVIT